MTREIEVGQFHRGRRIVSLKHTNSRGWSARDEGGTRYYQWGPGASPDGLHTRTDTGVTLSTWPAPPDAEPPKGLGESKKQAKKIRDTRPVRTAVKERDGGCVLRDHTVVWGPCLGGLEVHHMHKASAVGQYSLTNCVALCSFHNGEVENHPPRAKEWGLVVNSAIPISEARARRVAHGLPAALPDDLRDGAR